MYGYPQILEISLIFVKIDTLLSIKFREKYTVAH